MEYKTCSKCKEHKLISEFGYRNNKEKRLRSQCKVCENKRNLEFHHSNRKGGIARKAAYRYTLKSYGMDEKDFLGMYENQKGLCKICSKKIRNPFGDWTGEKQSIDHCHITGKVRGILCMKCNTSLGGFSDNVGMLQKAIEYLKQNEDS